MLLAATSTPCALCGAPPERQGVWVPTAETSQKLGAPEGKSVQKNPGDQCTPDETIWLQEPESDRDSGEVADPLTDVIATIKAHAQPAGNGVGFLDISPPGR